MVMWPMSGVALAWASTMCSNVPVIFGPNNQRFQEAQDLLASGGGKQISDYAEFEHIMCAYMADDALRLADGVKAGDYVRSKAGSTDKIIASI